MLPTSYLASYTYEEQSLLIGKKLDEIICFINNVLEQKMTEYIEAKFNDIMLASMYDTDTETLILYLNKEA